MKAAKDRQINRVIHKNPSAGRMPHVHYHEEHELYFLLSGVATYYIGDEIFHLEAGNFAFIPKGILHKTDYEGTESIERFVLYIEEGIFTEDMRFVKDELSKCRVIYLDEAYQEEIRNLFLRLERESMEEENPYTRLLLKLHMRELLIQLNRYKMDYKPALSGSNQLIYQISQYISNHFQESISLSELSREFAMSESHLSRKFKMHTGLGVSEYVTYVRIHYAERLLKGRDVSITQVAEQCGFNDSNYFSTVFKKIKGVTPRTYAKQYKKRAGLPE